MDRERLPAQEIEQPRPLEREVSAMLERVVADRMRALPGKEIPSPQSPDDLGDMPRERLMALQERLRVVACLNGHRGGLTRGLISRGTSPLGASMRRLYEGSAGVADGSVTLDALADIPTPDGLPESLTTDELYERMALAVRLPDTTQEAFATVQATEAARAVGLEPGATWVSVTEALFTEGATPDRVRALIERVGAIPGEVYTKKRFKSVGAEPIIKTIETLRELESGPMGAEALRERARLTAEFIVSGNANALRRKKTKHVFLDANGLLITLLGLHAHIPYGFADARLREALLRDGWMDEAELAEVSVREAEEDSRPDDARTAAERQIVPFASGLGLEGAPATVESLVAAAHKDPHAFAEALVRSRLVIPDAVLAKLMEQGAEGSWVAMEIAEAVSANLAREEFTADVRPFTSYELLDGAEGAYRARERILNSPQYYNASKVVRAFLLHGAQAETEDQQLKFRGAWKAARGGDRHAFVETVWRGRSARVLINEDKHLNAPLRQRLEALPSFERDSYEALEGAIRSFHNFSRAVQEIGQTQETPQTLTPSLAAACEASVHFILSNVTGKHLEASRLYTAFREMVRNGGEGDITATWQQFTETLVSARETYAQFLYQNAKNPQAFVERFSPEVARHDVSFGETFLKNAREHCVSYGFDESLCRDAQPVRVVSLAYKAEDPTQAIPFHIEESCLDALRINRHRPLISVIGGCKKLEGEEGRSSLERMSDAVLHVAHARRANVAVPGTQSGIGITFGRANTRYRNTFGHLPWDAQAHLFAISPGANTYHPENPFARADLKENTYALTPVDSILTPFEAGWGTYEGLEKLKSPYLDHIAYMEALSRRMSVGEPQVVVAGNGGFYSIAEANELLQHGFSLILLADSGRFAEVGSILMPRIGEFDTSDPARFERQITACVQREAASKVADEFFTKDFGDGTPSDDGQYTAYQEFLRRFVVRAREHRDRIAVTTLDTLEPVLSRAVA